MNSNSIMKSIYIGHGAPWLLDDKIWSDQLRTLANNLTRPKAILIVSAHWEAAPISISSPEKGVPLVYDFSGFAPKYYQETYNSSGDLGMIKRIESLLGERINVDYSRGLDHGAWVPLKIMYPEADIPTLQLSLPTMDPEKLLAIGKKLSPLREEGILIIGSGFLTHGLRYLDDWSIDATPPAWSVEFDHWVDENLKAKTYDNLLNYKSSSPALKYAHPTVEHFTPIFVTLGAGLEYQDKVEIEIEGFWMGLSKRSFSI